jgi:hypothetical protein
MLIRVLTSFGFLDCLASRIPEFQPLRPRLLAHLRRRERTGLELLTFTQAGGQIAREIKDALH